MNAAIAKHLNIAESAIVRVEEWAHVVFVVIRGIGARFVSKKVVAIMSDKYEHEIHEALCIVLGRWVPDQPRETLKDSPSPWIAGPEYYLIDGQKVYLKDIRNAMSDEVCAKYVFQGPKEYIPSQGWEQ